VWRATSVIIYSIKGCLHGLSGRNPSCTSLYEFMILWFGEAVEESYSGSFKKKQFHGKTLTAVLKEQERTKETQCQNNGHSLHSQDHHPPPDFPHIKNKTPRPFRLQNFPHANISVWCYCILLLYVFDQI